MVELPEGLEDFSIRVAGFCTAKNRKKNEGAKLGQWRSRRREKNMSFSLCKSFKFEGMLTTNNGLKYKKKGKVHTYSFHPLWFKQCDKQQVFRKNIAGWWALYLQNRPKP